MLTLAGLLWRQGADVRRSVDGLSARMDALAVTVGDIDRRLARVEGRIAGPPWVPSQAPEGHDGVG